MCMDTLRYIANAYHEEVGTKSRNLGNVDRQHNKLPANVINAPENYEVPYLLNKKNLIDMNCI